MPTTSTCVQYLPLVDLKAQYETVHAEIAEAIGGVLESACYIGGTAVEAFEDEFSRFVGAKYCIGVSSGTAALELALRAAGIGPGDEVIVPANSFFATAEAVSNVGAMPLFADVDPITFLLDLRSVESLTTTRVRAVIPVHLYGRAMDIAPLEAFATPRGIRIIEDSAQAHGAAFGGKTVGGSGRLTCFSFYPGKNLGAYGDGGAVTTNDAQEADLLRMLRNHGSKIKYEHSLIGTTARLDAIQAAVLSVKLRHLADWNSRRVEHALAYTTALAESSACTPDLGLDGQHVFHLYVIRHPRRQALSDFLRARGIQTGIHYPVPLHLTTAYQAKGYRGWGTLPVAEQVCSDVLSLPMYPELTSAQIDATVSAIQEFDAIASAARNDEL